MRDSYAGMAKVKLGDMPMVFNNRR